MGKKKKICMAILAPSLLLASCSKGVEKEYVIDVKEIVEVKRKDGSSASAAHCKRSLSAYNYYILIPEGVDPNGKSQLNARSGGDELTFDLSGKEVTDHGYKFISFKE